MTEAPVADRTLDAKGLLCPMPIVKLSRLIKEMDSSQVVLMEATDPGSVPDVTAWAKQTGNTLEAHEQVGNVMRFWIRKA
jgi:tRNA 2-thiouridine synthesizing protein A